MARFPNTNIMASITFDLPLPFGPTTDEKHCGQSQRGRQGRSGLSCQLHTRHLRCCKPTTFLSLISLHRMPLRFCYGKREGRLLRRDVLTGPVLGAMQHLVERPHALLPGIGLEVVKVHFLDREPGLGSAITSGSSVDLHCFLSRSKGSQCMCRGCCRSNRPNSDCRLVVAGLERFWEACRQRSLGSTGSIRSRLLVASRVGISLTALLFVWPLASGSVRVGAEHREHFRLTRTRKSRAGRSRKFEMRPSQTASRRIRYGTVPPPAGLTHGRGA